MKSDNKTFVAPAIVFTPLKPITSAHGSSGGHPTTLQPLVHTWTRPVVLLSPATPWAAQPSIPSASEISSMQNNYQKEKVMDMASADSMQVGDDSNVRWVPRIDMLFDSENDAYEFYNTFAENVGFIVRRSTLWTSKNIITRRTFVCSREGFREKKKGAKEAKCPRPETRIGCEACMTIRLTPSGKYRVTEFVPNHNHPIATVSTIHTLRAKKLRRKARVARADLTDDTVTTPEFETEDDAYEFYNMYAGRLGFSVRRASVTVNAENMITRRMFVCSREGFREQKKGAKRVKKPRPEFRTGCPACMVIRITPSGKYQVTEFVTYHNHQLEASLSTENLISPTADNGLDRAAEMTDESAETTDHKQIQSHQNCSLFPSDKKNHLQTKRIKAIRVGDAGATLEYLQKMQEDNPSFYYAIQVNKDDDISNFFWADAKSMMDFCYFGDVVCFDTSYKILGYGRPLVLFTGVNHHHQTIIFGAALLYDESADSMKWLFESCKAAMSGKQPKTILTDRSAAISEAIAAVWPGTIHRFCIWHIYQNAVMQLSQAFHGSRTFGYDFSRCLFDFEDDEDFLREWEAMSRKYELKENEWLGQLFKEREKWSLVYGREAFYADMKSVQQKESIGTELKKYLAVETDLLCFFENYERILSEKRFAELQADFSASLNTKKPPSMRMLKQAANAYTPAAYRMFEREFESYMGCMLYSLGEIGTISRYNVIVDEKPKEHLVRFDSLDGSATCSCKKFEFLGIQCCHVLKVLDTRNIKEIPSQYILKRWRKDAKNSELSQKIALSFGDPQSSVANRCNILCHIFGLAAAHAAKSSDSYAFLEGQAELLNNQIEQFLQTRPGETTSVISAPSDRLQNPVESGVPESLQYDKTNQAIFVDSTAHGFLGSRQSHPTMCWGQFSSGPPEL